jgi:enoyl-CoA hydratase/carnithine racemase
MFELRIDGPAKNALGDAMMTRLFDGLREADGRPILFLGTGDAFSAGLHLREVAALDGNGMERFLARLEELMSAIFQYPAPTVAYVNGHAIAGGCIIALCCDWRVARAGTDSKIGLNEVAIGLRFPPRILEICRRRLSVHHLGEVLLGAKLYGPDEALRVGLVDEVSERAEDAARAHLAALAALPSEAYAATKRDLRGSSPADLMDDATWERQMLDLYPVWTDPALKENVARVLSAKR